MTESPIRHGGKVVVGYEGGPTGHDALTFADPVGRSPRGTR